MARVCSLSLVIALMARIMVAAGRVKRRNTKSALSAYTFAEYVKDFDKGYAEGTKEYRHRSEIWETSMARIQALNEKNIKERRPWAAGVHPFMDWSEAEKKVLHGYKPARGRAQTAGAGMLQTHSQGLSRTNGLGRSNMTRVSNFAWESSRSIRNQGNCGSCWAISAVEAVEAQLHQSNPDVRLSAQALVDCVPNPQHCGGTGGCDGATGELAYTFMRDHGIPLEEELRYHAKTDACPEKKLDGAWPAAQRARVTGWNQLPSNKAEPLEQAIVQQGPVVVAVDGNDWFDYDNGIYDGCHKDAELGHAVLAKGYGEENGKKYWLIQNSWGANWGENGFIRLLRPANEDSWCGTDHNPKDGVGCDGGPPAVTVCGMCGLLYDPLVPEGVRLEGGENAAAEKPTIDFLNKAGVQGAEDKLPDFDTWNKKSESDEENIDRLLRRLNR